MDNLVVSTYITILDRLDLESRLTILSALTDSIKDSMKTSKNVNKSDLLSELYGAWKDVDEGIVDDIYKGREIPDREISFD